jgi:hypothetical protein
MRGISLSMLVLMACFNPMQAAAQVPVFDAGALLQMGKNYAQDKILGDLTLDNLKESIQTNFNLKDQTGKMLLGHNKINDKQEEQIKQTDYIIDENKVSVIALKSSGLAYQDMADKRKAELLKLSQDLGKDIYRTGTAADSTICSDGKRLGSAPKAGVEMKSRCEEAQDWRAVKQKVAEDYWVKMAVIQEDMKTIANAPLKTNGDMTSKQVALSFVRETLATINSVYQADNDYINAKLTVAEDIRQRASNTVTAGKPSTGITWTSVISNVTGAVAGSVIKPAMSNGW